METSSVCAEKFPKCCRYMSQILKIKMTSMT